MNYIKRFSRHYSTKYWIERTTADSLDANLLFEFEPQESWVKLTEEFYLPIIRKWDEDSDSEDSNRNSEFATINSFLSLKILDLNVIKSKQTGIVTNSCLQNNTWSLAFTNKIQFLIGISILILMIVSCSLVGPLTVALPSQSPFIQIFWRYFGSTLISMPIMLAFYTAKRSEMSVCSDFTPRKILKCAVNSLLIFIWNLGFVLGWTMTVVSHAKLWNSGGVFILVLSVILKRRIHQYELIGYGLFVVGIILMFLDPFATKADLSTQSSFGIVFSIVGAFSWAFYSYINENFDDSTHLFVAITQNFMLSTVMQMIVYPFVFGPGLFFSFDPMYGAFGWIYSTSTCLQVIATSLITGIMCHLTFYLSYMYFPVSVIAVAMFFEPLFAQAFSILLGQDLIPGWLTIVGWLTAICGFAVSGYGLTLKFKSGRKEIPTHKIYQDDEEDSYKKLE